MKKSRNIAVALAVVIAVGAALRLAAVLPGLWSDPERRFARPDTAGYVELARYFTGAAALGGTAPPTRRAPGYPLLLAAVSGLGGGAGAAALVGVLLGVLTIPVVFLIARELLENAAAAVLAAAFCALNLTAIANAPLLLSDTAFGLTAALQLLCFARFWKRRRGGWFLAALGVAAIGTLVRPINLLWWIPALVLLGCVPQVEWRVRIRLGLWGVALFFALLLPWMGRNASLGAGWCIDTNTGAMHHQNGAMLLAEVNRSGFETEKQLILAGQRREFADEFRYPDEKSREAYRLREYRKLIFSHPGIWLRQQCFNWPILLPDAPAACEVLGVTVSDRGTMGVLARDGLAAAVRHYFAGHEWMLAVLLPLLAVSGALYLGALGALLGAVLSLRRFWYVLLGFMAFVEYYLWLPGAITAPRYQLPALPLLAVLAAAFWTSWRRNGTGTDGSR